LRLLEEAAAVVLSAERAFQFEIRDVGRLQWTASATYKERRGMGSTGLVVVTTPMQVSLLDPLGQPFTRPSITTTDLNRYRNLQGVTQGAWTIKLSFHKRYRTARLPGEPALNAPIPLHCDFSFGLVEDAQDSPGALVAMQAPAFGGLTRTSFDLFRVGNVVASVRSAGPRGGFAKPWQGSLRLKDPDGVVMATSASNNLHFAVTLRLLDRSRAADGRVRPWSLEAQAAPRGGAGQISATVVATFRLPISALQDRLTALLGADGRTQGRHHHAASAGHPGHRGPGQRRRRRLAHIARQRVDGRRTGGQARWVRTGHGGRARPSHHAGGFGQTRCCRWTGRRDHRAPRPARPGPALGGGAGRRRAGWADAGAGCCGRDPAD